MTLTSTEQIGLPPPGYRLPGTAHVGKVRLAVSSLPRSVAFYSQVIGLAVIDPGAAETRLAKLGTHGEGQVLLELEELPGVQPLGRRTRLGLYHTAFLLPTREAVSSFVEHLIAENVTFGSSDHGVSEALYLTDPDGLSVEVYADRPRSTWRIKDRQIQGGIDPLRFDQLPAVPKDSWQGMPAGSTIGHLHFYADDLNKAAQFYHAGLGLDQSTWAIPGGLFMSAGGYHHHVGVNVWAAGLPVASARDARLLFWELVLPDTEEVGRVTASMKAAGHAQTIAPSGALAFTDAWGITVALVVADSCYSKMADCQGKSRMAPVTA